jgi:hypothetical protein
LQQQVERATNRVKNVAAGALAVVGFSEALLAQLKEEETSLNALRARLAAASRDRRPKILPHPHVIQSYVDRLLDLLETDVEQAHALLVRHMPPLVLTPEAGPYRLTGGFNLSLHLPSDASTNTTAGDDSHAPREESMIGPVGGTVYSVHHRPTIWLEIRRIIE